MKLKKGDKVWIYSPVHEHIGNITKIDNGLCEVQIGEFKVSEWEKNLFKYPEQKKELLERLIDDTTTIMMYRNRLENME